jgi:hypothetical protein
MCQFFLICADMFFSHDTIIWVDIIYLVQDQFRKELNSLDVESSSWRIVDDVSTDKIVFPEVLLEVTTDTHIETENSTSSGK